MTSFLFLTKATRAQAKQWLNSSNHQNIKFKMEDENHNYIKFFGFSTDSE
jgi:hypothetical protein